MFRLSSLGLALCLLFVARVAPAQITLDHETCSQAFLHSFRDTIHCQAAFRLAPQQRQTLQRLSYGLLSDLTCSARIAARRSEILKQLHPTCNVHLPPQIVRCRLMAQGQPLPIHFSVAPVVRMNKGRAVSAELGIRDIHGIPEPAATAVAGLLNNDASLRKTLVQAANDFLATMPKR